MSTPFVLITGASGFIGAEVLHLALAKGLRTRVTVRKEEQAATIKARHPEAADHLEVVVVPDLADEAALTKALTGGIDYVLHVASPMPNPGLDLQTGYIDPAVQGTVAVLNAAKSVPSVKRVIITSSALALASLYYTQTPGYEIKAGANLSLVADPSAPVPEGPSAEGYKYHLSKLLAHRATLEWVAKNRAEGVTRPEVVTIHPYFVIGHDRTQAAKGGQAHGVPHMYLASLQMPQPFISSALVDVKDVAAVHVAAVGASSTVLEDNGQSVTEVIAKGPRITWEEIVDYVKKEYPTFPLGQTSSGIFKVPPTSDTTRAQRDFGVPKFREPLDTVKDLLEQNTE